jgi:hypothetical protein
VGNLVFIVQVGIELNSADNICGIHGTNKAFPIIADQRTTSGGYPVFKNRSSRLLAVGSHGSRYQKPSSRVKLYGGGEQISQVQPSNRIWDRSCIQKDFLL